MDYSRILSDELSRTDIVRYLEANRSQYNLTEERVSEIIARLKADPWLVIEPLPGAVPLKIGRPPLQIMDGKLPSVTSKRWGPVLTDEVRAKLEACIAAVGRIHVEGLSPNLASDMSWAGTAWFIKPDVLITAAHVAKQFAYFGSDDTFHFKNRRDTGSGEMQVTIDLGQEQVGVKGRRFKVTKVLSLGKLADSNNDSPSSGDFAFLEIEARPNEQPAPIVLATDLPTGKTDVAVIGYPEAIFECKNLTDIPDLFEHRFGIKRFMPGEVMEVKESLIAHDCATLGGSSGGPLICIATGKAVGLHIGGKYDEKKFAIENDAISSNILNDALRGLK